MNRFRRIFLGLLAFAAAVSSNALLSAAEQQASKPEHVNYGRPFEPPTRPALITLPQPSVMCMLARPRGRMKFTHSRRSSPGPSWHMRAVWTPGSSSIGFSAGRRTAGPAWNKHIAKTTTWLRPTSGHS